MKEAEPRDILSSLRLSSFRAFVTVLYKRVWPTIYSGAAYIYGTVRWWLLSDEVQDVLSPFNSVVCWHNAGHIYMIWHYWCRIWRISSIFRVCKHDVVMYAIATFCRVYCSRLHGAFDRTVTARAFAKAIKNCFYQTKRNRETMIPEYSLFWLVVIWLIVIKPQSKNKEQKVSRSDY
jgi:hypothetical protein